MRKGRDIRAVSSENTADLAAYVNSKGGYQYGHSHSLISACVDRYPDSILSLVSTIKL